MEEWRPEAPAQRPVCPHCASPATIRFGFERSELQRYRCKRCQHRFNEHSGTLLKHAKKPATWEGFPRCFQEGYSLRRTAQELHVHRNTAFAWRHKLLANLGKAPKPVLTGVYEAGEVRFRRSWKGGKPVGRAAYKRGGRGRNGRPTGQGKDKVFVLVARDRSGQTVSFVLDRMTHKAVEAEFAGVVKASVLCTDGSGAIEAYRVTHYVREGLQHYTLKEKRTQVVKDQLYHIQNVNSYHSRFREWIGRFRGVATKYLQPYAAWHLFVE